MFKPNRPDHAINPSAVRGNGRKTWKILELIYVVPNDGDKGLLRYPMDRLAKIREFQLPGIYVWSHCVFGIFYVGLNNKSVDVTGKTARGVGQRWPAHIDKMLNRLRSETGRTRAWTRFSRVIAVNSEYDISKVKDDLTDIWVTYIPFHGDNKALKNREKRMIKKLNPYANEEREWKKNKARPSSTKVTPISLLA